MNIKIKYFASLREKAQKDEEPYIVKEQTDLLGIYNDLKKKYDFDLSFEQVNYAVNNDYVERDYKLQDGDILVFIPPVAGG